MDKLQMAHEYAMQAIDTGYVCETDNLVLESWKYADAMQAEADKRNGGVPEAILNLSNSKPLEWQPDWSIAPIWAEYWFKDEDDCFWWSKRAPYFLENQVSKIIVNNTNVIALSFNYKGSWQDSLRKRPEGV